jgi:glycosyltransferase involved in cell wall biosynthesis
LLLEPYYDGSHRQLVDGLRRHVLPDAELWTLPARKWKWRMRGAALEFARRVRDTGIVPRAVFASSMLNAAEFRALLPRSLRGVPLVVYFHENQLTYPVQDFDPRDHHFAWTNVHTALAADRVLWNSAYNREEFLGALRRLIRKMPDARPEWAVDVIAERSEVLPVPIDDERIATDVAGVEPRRGRCHVVWNHRWEHDKGPERLRTAVDALCAADVDFEMSVVGQRFRTSPAVFDVIAERLGDRRRAWGFLESRRDYHRLLASADVVLSTADHEFQGLAVLEGAAAGAVPLVPDALAYPEIWPAEWRYRDDADLVAKLLDRVRAPDRWRAVDARGAATGYGWTRLAVPWHDALSIAAGPGPVR